MRIPINQWGKDHWSALAYVEVRCVDNNGVLKNAHMRTDAKRHPLFMVRYMGPGDGSGYPTRYKDGELADHDDWDCLNDLVEAGLIAVKPGAAELWEVPVGMRGPIKYQGRVRTKELKVAVRMLPEGSRIAGELRTHLTRERKYHTFSPSNALFDRVAEYLASPAGAES